MGVIAQSHTRFDVGELSEGRNGGGTGMSQKAGRLTRHAYSRSASPGGDLTRFEYKFLRKLVYGRQTTTLAARVNRETHV